MRVRFSYPALIKCGVLAVVASQAHNLKVGGSTPPPATNIYNMGEENNIRYGKLMVASEAPTIREIVELANELHIPREDVVSILPSRDGFMIIYYY